MNKLTREDIILFLKIAISIALIIVAVKFFINILPLIILLLIIILLVDSFMKSDYMKAKRKEKAEQNRIREAEIIAEREKEK